MNFILSSKMFGDHNNKATCSNSLPQEEENAVWQEAGSRFIHCDPTNSATTDDNGTTSVTDGNPTTTGIEGSKLKKLCRERLTRGNLINAHDDGLGFQGWGTLAKQQTGQPN
jgi:hypothetical protein